MEDAYSEPKSIEAMEIEPQESKVPEQLGEIEPSKVPPPEDVAEQAQAQHLPKKAGDEQEDGQHLYTLPEKEATSTHAAAAVVTEMAVPATEAAASTLPQQLEEGEEQAQEVKQEEPSEPVQLQQESEEAALSMEPDVEVPQQPKGPLRTWEPCAIPAAAQGEAPVEFMVPSALTVLGDLSQVLNTTTWNELLTEEERDQLRAYLPATQSARQQEATVKRLLGGENFNFSSPLTTFFRDFKSGFYHRDVVRYKAKVEKLQRRKYELDLMSYRARQLQHVLAWKDAAGLIAPGSAEDRVWQTPPRRIYAMSSRRGDGGLESSPASAKRKRKRTESENGGANKENEAAGANHLDRRSKKAAKKSAKKNSDKRAREREVELDVEEEEEQQEEEEEEEEYDYTAGRGRADGKRLKHDASGMSKAMKAKNKEREDAAEASASAYPIIFVFFGKLRDAFRALDNSATLDALVEKLKAAGNVEDDRLPQYPLKEFVRLALEFLASPPPPTAPFSLGSGASSSSSSPLGSASGGLSPDALPIVKYERAKKAWRWLPKDNKVYRLQSIEQLFYFAAARNMVDSKTGNLTLATVKQHKCTNTIELSSPEAMASHRLQETDRYGNPERAFTYVTNGMKAVVGPVKHTGSATRGPSNKPREHFLLKTKRPAHVNLLGLVRDAAARLPGGVGTRPDVAILLKDSQWVVEEIPNGKLNTVVSGALDRLHSQNDPCVRFDPDQKLWIYLHRLRKENDFEVRPFPKSKSQKKSQASSPSTPSQNFKSPPQPSADDSLSSPPSPATHHHIISSSPPSSPYSSSSPPSSPPQQQQQQDHQPPPSSSTNHHLAALASHSSTSSPFSTSSTMPSYGSAPRPSASSPSLSQPMFPSLTLHPLPPSTGSPSSRQSPTASTSPYASPSLGSFRSLPFQHLAHGGGMSPSLGPMPFMHYSTIPPPTPLPPLHPHPATSMTLHPPFTSAMPPSPSSSSSASAPLSSLQFPSYSPSPSPSSAPGGSSSTLPLPRLQLPPVQPSPHHLPHRDWNSDY